MNKNLFDAQPTAFNEMWNEKCEMNKNLRDAQPTAHLSEFSPFKEPASVIVTPGIGL